MLDLKHKNLEVYKKSFELVRMVYKVSSEIPQSELYRLISQIRRRAVSVISNISEGASGNHQMREKDFMKYPDLHWSNLIHK